MIGTTMRARCGRAGCRHRPALSRATPTATSVVVGGERRPRRFGNVLLDRVLLANVSRSPVPKDGCPRLGSITETSVATAMLQPVNGERLTLDRTVEHLLPGVVTGAGDDGSTIALRDPLQHTGGLYDRTADAFPAASAQTYCASRWHACRPARRAATAMRHEPAFPPGNGPGVLPRDPRPRRDDRRGGHRPLPGAASPRRHPASPRTASNGHPGTRPFLSSPHAADCQPFAPVAPWSTPRPPAGLSTAGPMARWPARHAISTTSSPQRPADGCRDPPPSPPCGPHLGQWPDDRGSAASPVIPPS